MRFLVTILLLAALRLSAQTNLCVVCYISTTNRVSVFEENLFPPSSPLLVARVPVCTNHLSSITNTPPRWLDATNNTIITFGAPVVWSNVVMKVAGRPETGRQK